MPILLPSPLMRALSPLCFIPGSAITAPMIAFTSTASDSACSATGSQSFSSLVSVSTLAKLGNTLKLAKDSHQSSCGMNSMRSADIKTAEFFFHLSHNGRHKWICLPCCTNSSLEVAIGLSLQNSVTQLEVAIDYGFAAGCIRCGTLLRRCIVLIDETR